MPKKNRESMIVPLRRWLLLLFTDTLVSAVAAETDLFLISGPFTTIFRLIPLLTLSGFEKSEGLVQLVPTIIFLPFLPKKFCLEASLSFSGVVSSEICLSFVPFNLISSIITPLSVNKNV
jgi:hypothetical protein